MHKFIQFSVLFLTLFVGCSLADDVVDGEFINDLMRFSHRKLNALFNKNFVLDYKDDNFSHVRIKGFPLVQFTCPMHILPVEDYAAIKGCMQISELKVALKYKPAKLLPKSKVILEVHPLEMAFKLGFFPKENPDRPKYEFAFTKPTTHVAGIELLSLVKLVFKKWEGVKMEGSALSKLANTALKIKGIGKKVKQIVEETLGPMAAGLLYQYARIPTEIMGNTLNNNF